LRKERIRPEPLAAEKPARVAVLDLDVLDLPPRIEQADSHAGALALLRIAGRPCGQAVLSFAHWRHDRPVIENVTAGANAPFWEAWLRYRLGEWESDDGAAPTAPAADIVICTRDRPDDLRKCLQGLMAMPQDGQEIIVVDNASRTEETRHIVESFAGVRYLREDRPGLDIARNTGLRAARHEVVAFIDDDAAPDRLWLRRLRRNFDRPSVAAAGGLTMPMELETEAQIGFERVGGLGRGFRHVLYDQTNCDAFRAWCAGAGVNMALRRSVLDRIGWFDEALDAGTQAFAGGDADFFRRIINAGWQIAYDPEALNWHRHRRTMAELEQQIFGYEVSNFAIMTKSLVYERDAGALGALARWLRMRAPQLVTLATGRRQGLPFNPLVPQMRGALAGPRRYRAAVKALRSRD